MIPELITKPERLNVCAGPAIAMRELGLEHGSVIESTARTMFVGEEGSFLREGFLDMSIHHTCSCVSSLVS